MKRRGISGQHSNAVRPCIWELIKAQGFHTVRAFTAARLPDRINGKSKLGKLIRRDVLSSIPIPEFLDLATALRVSPGTLLDRFLADEGALLAARPETQDISIALGLIRETRELIDKLTASVHLPPDIWESVVCLSDQLPLKPSQEAVTQYNWTSLVDVMDGIIKEALKRNRIKEANVCKSVRTRLLQLERIRQVEKNRQCLNDQAIQKQEIYQRALITDLNQRRPR